MTAGSVMESNDALVVNVEQRHIDAGARGDWLRCPVGLALAELGAHIELPTAYVHRPDWMPVAMERFIIAFDKGRKVKPTVFMISLKPLINIAKWSEQVGGILGGPPLALV